MGYFSFLTMNNKAVITNIILFFYVYVGHNHLLLLGIYHFSLVLVLRVDSAFEHFKMYFYCSIASKTSTEKLVIRSYIVPLKVNVLFPTAAFKMILFWVFHSFIMTCLNVVFFVYILL